MYSMYSTVIPPSPGASVTTAQTRQTRRPVFIMTVKHHFVIEREGVHARSHAHVCWVKWAVCGESEKNLLQFHEVTHNNGIPSAGIIPVFMANVKWVTSYCIDCCFTREKHLWSSIALKPGKCFLEGIFIVEIRHKPIPELVSAGEARTHAFFLMAYFFHIGPGRLLKQFRTFKWQYKSFISSKSIATLVLELDREMFQVYEQQGVLNQLVLENLSLALCLFGAIVIIILDVWIRNGVPFVKLAKPASASVTVSVVHSHSDAEDMKVTLLYFTFLCGKTHRRDQYAKVQATNTQNGLLISKLCSGNHPRTLQHSASILSAHFTQKSCWI